MVNHHEYIMNVVSPCWFQRDWEDSGQAIAYEAFIRWRLLFK